MARHLRSHLERGHRCPGILIVRPATRIPEVLDCLELIAFAGDPVEFADAITYVP
jgi:hypothetical protein